MIYVIGTGTSTRRHRLPIKIGTSNNPPARLAEMQTGSPVKLRLLVTAPGDRAREAALHAQFRRWRQHGEWFALPAAEMRRLVRILTGAETVHPRIERAQAARRDATSKRRERLRHAGLIPADRPRATLVKVSYMPSPVAELGDGPFGHTLFGFVCPGCGTRFERTSRPAAERFHREHVAACIAAVPSRP